MKGIVNRKFSGFNLFFLAFIFLIGCKSTEVVFMGVFKKDFSSTKKTEIQDQTENEKGDQTEKIKGQYLGNSLDSASMSGIVIASDGILLPNAQVSFKKATPKTEQLWTTFEADKKGKFLIKNIDAGNYELACLYPQYYLEVVSDISLIKNEEISGLRVVLNPTFKGTGNK